MLSHILDVYMICIWTILQKWCKLLFEKQKTFNYIQILDVY